MVTADNLNLDVLELIFYHLYGNDLVSVALVSRSFFAGVIPRLYCSLLFRLSQAKRYPVVSSPFSTILVHPDLAIHVRNVDIRFIPRLKSKFHAKFLADSTCALDKCRNLSSFVCTVPALPSFLLCLQEKERLQDIRVNAPLTNDQTQKLILLRGLKSVTLDYPSWNVIDALPKWATSIHRTLTSLTLYMAAELNETVLQSTLIQLPRLTGLHIIGCPKIDHVAIFKFLTHTPSVESLSFSIWPTSRILSTPHPDLPHLRQLSIETYPLPPSTPPPSILPTIMSAIRQSSALLTSMSFKLSDAEETISSSFIEDIINAHGPTLTRLAFINFTLPLISLSAICYRCTNLEVLQLAIPIKDSILLSGALSQSKTLHTLIDIDDTHSNHGPRLALNQENIRYMLRATPNLCKIVTDGRIWMRQPSRSERQGDINVSLERYKPTAPNHWFMAR